MAQHKGYGQFCPVARASEILAERWGPLVVRELLAGSVRFSDLQRGVPRMSSALLSKRLKDLAHAGIVERRPTADGRGAEYHLTAAGRELYPIVEGMGLWAQRWVRNDLVANENLDPDLLMWDVRRGVLRGEPPGRERYVVRVEFSGVPANRRRYWLVYDRGEIDLCIKDPGFDTNLYLYGHVRAMTEVWLGHVTLNQAIWSGQLRLEGNRTVIRKFRAWFVLSGFAEAGRRPPGRAA